jgi:hypothetical protein|nr:MAG TPA: hypothetical protein [Caudoviricetes sp.]
MKRLRAGDPNRQEVWAANGALFSIVDLGIPLHFDEMKRHITTEEAKRIKKLFANVAKRRKSNIELARVDGGVEILGRFRTFRQARRFIKENYED